MLVGRPGDGGVVVCARLHVIKRDVIEGIVRVHVGHAVEHGDELGAGRRAGGVDRSVAHAVHDAVFQAVVQTLMRPPIRRGHVGEAIAGAGRAASAGRGRERFGARFAAARAGVKDAPLRGAGRLPDGHAAVPRVAERGGRIRAVADLRAAVFADVLRIARLRARRRDDDRFRRMAGGGDDVRLRCAADGAGVCALPVFRAGGRGDRLRQLIFVAGRRGAGAFHDAEQRAAHGAAALRIAHPGTRRRHDHVHRRVRDSVRHVAVQHFAAVVAGVDGVALLGAGRRDGLTLRERAAVLVMEAEVPRLGVVAVPQAVGDDPGVVVLGIVDEDHALDEACAGLVRRRDGRRVAVAVGVRQRGAERKRAAADRLRLRARAQGELRQRRAAGKRALADARNAAGHVQRGQRFTAEEGAAADRLQSGGQRQLRQLGAAGKGLLADGGERAGQVDALQQNAQRERARADLRGGRGERHVGQPARAEAVLRHDGDRVGQCDGREQLAGAERARAERLQPLRQRDAQQRLAVAERIVADGGDRRRDGRFRQQLAAVDRALADGGDRAVAGHGEQRFAVGEAARRHGRDRRGQGGFRERVAACKGIGAESLHRFGHCDALQTVAPGVGVRAERLYAVGQRQRLERVARGHGVVADGSQRLRQRRERQIVARGECVARQLRQPGGELHRGQLRQRKEGEFADVRNGVGDLDALDAGGLDERKVDAHDVFEVPPRRQYARGEVKILHRAAAGDRQHAVFDAPMEVVALRAEIAGRLRRRGGGEDGAHVQILQIQLVEQLLVKILVQRGLRRFADRVVDQPGRRIHSQPGKQRRDHADGQQQRQQSFLHHEPP